MDYCPADLTSDGVNEYVLRTNLPEIYS